MSKLDSLFFDDPPSISTAPARPAYAIEQEISAAVTSTHGPIVPTMNTAADLSQFFLFAPTPAKIDPPPPPLAAASITAGILYGSYHDEAWSTTEEIDPSTITPCPKCKGLEFWTSAADATKEICQRCQPPKIQKLRNWMNRREMLLNIHQQQREEDERQQRARAIAAGDRTGDDDGAGDDELDPTAEA